MKKILTALTVLTMVCQHFNATAKNYFDVEGVVWEGVYTDSHPDFTEIQYSYVLVASDVLDGHKSLAIVDKNTADTQNGLRVYCDGDKVYCFHEAQWRLMYDFSLAEGEGATIYDPTVPSNQNEGYVVCIERREDAANPGFTEMTMVQFENESSYKEYIAHNQDFNGYCNIGKWIAGIGNVTNPLNSNVMGVVGASSRLMYVTDGTETVYTSAYVAGIDNLADNHLSLKIEKGDVTVENADDTMLIDINGRCLKAADGRFKALPPGMYILVAPEVRRKIIIR